MNEFIIKQIADEEKIGIQQVQSVLKLLSEDNTIPFIARYRKDITGGLNEEQIKKIEEVYQYQVNLSKRKEDIIRLIDEKGLLTDELKDSINKCNKLVEVEDLYRPYKEKKKTKATEAIKNGLEPLAKIIMSQNTNTDIEVIAEKYLNDSVKTVSDAIQGAKYIISEWISDNAYYRKWIRNYIYRNGVIVSKIKKNAIDDNKIYEMYYDYSELVKNIKPHRILAINRGEKEDVLNVSIDIDSDEVINFLQNKNIKNDGQFKEYIIDSIKDSYKRLIFPSIEREIRADLTDKGENSAIDNFGKNLEALLLTPPLKEKTVLGFDPGFVNGCKLAVVDKFGKYLDSTVIKPFLNGQKTSDRITQYKEIVVNLIKKYNVDIIAIGNGTASRESEKFCSEMIKEYGLNCKYVIVSEAGASIYSASPVALQEFPDLEIEKRSAVSIGRRIQDPLAELVKIPPDGIGVGLYQHDVSQKKLSESLDFVVQKCVNSVGVNINTASPSLLKYVSGFSKKTIDKIIAYRDKVGKILSREELINKNILTDKTYQQSIGFLRVVDGDDILDSTAIHPESYNVAIKLLELLNEDYSSIGKEQLVSKLELINVDEYKSILNTDKYTLEDVIASLKKPNLDPRDEMPQPILKSDILNINDLQVGMMLQGTVRNVVDFGLFIDIGLHNDGLAHISKLCNQFIKHPSELFSVGDIVDCYVCDINKEKEKVSLSLIKDV